MKRLYLVICSIIILFSSCLKEHPQPDRSDEITILAYLVANNNLDSDLLANIGAMYDGLGNMDQQATLLIY